MAQQDILEILKKKRSKKKTDKYYTAAEIEEMLNGTCNATAVRRQLRKLVAWGYLKIRFRKLGKYAGFIPTYRVSDRYIELLKKKAD